MRITLLERAEQERKKLTNKRRQQAYDIASRVFGRVLKLYNEGERDFDEQIRCSTRGPNSETVIGYYSTYDYPEDTGLGIVGFEIRTNKLFFSFSKSEDFEERIRKIDTVYFALYDQKIPNKDLVTGGALKNSMHRAGRRRTTEAPPSKIIDTGD